MLSGAQILVQSLVDVGIDVVFGYPGGQVLPVYDALYDAKDKIRHILTSHEQGAAHAADGFSRSTGKVGVCLATSGPGATNLVTGIAAAYMDSVPMVAITGNVALNLIGRDAFQEIDITGVTIPITKHSYMVKDVENLEEIIKKAFVIASSGRPGPVLVDIPKDIQLAKTTYKNLKIKPKDTVEFFDEEKTLELLKESKKPLLYCGGGVVSANASTDMTAFIEKYDCPVIFSMMGITALPFDNPKNLGLSGIHGKDVSDKAARECDLIIACGTRFSERMWGKDKFNNAKIIHIDIDDSEHGKNLSCDLYIKKDLKEVFQNLTNSMEKAEHEEWISSLFLLKQKSLENCDKSFTMQKIIDTVSLNFDKDTFVVTDVGQHQVATAQNYKFYKPRKFLSSCGLGAMGYGMGAAIGAKTANPKSTVLLITGDGSFHMNFNELACAISENLPIIVLVFNNSSLGLVRQLQSAFYRDRCYCSGFSKKTDYVQLSRSLGADGAVAKNFNELYAALKSAKVSNMPFVIECVINKNEDIYPFDVNVN